MEALMREPNALISTDALVRELDGDNLRVFDCTTYLEPPPPGSDDPYIAVPGRSSFGTEHIPGADFLDIQGEFSDNATASIHDAASGAGRGRIRPPWHRRECARRALQHRDDDVGHAILVDAEGARLRRSCVLDGGFDKWLSEGLPVEHGPAKGYPPAVFSAKPRPGRFVDKQRVLAASEDPDFVIVNALGPQFHQGLEPSRYGRPGRIPGSVNVPAANLVDPQRKTFTTLDDAAAKFAAAGVGKDRHIVVYCAVAYQPPSIFSCCTSLGSTI
jgi:thiosulfate/3-mercaptopyruvate sulfurtransferase